VLIFIGVGIGFIFHCSLDHQLIVRLWRIQWSNQTTRQPLFLNFVLHNLE
jgi:hypothetical protein